MLVLPVVISQRKQDSDAAQHELSLARRVPHERDPDPLQPGPRIDSPGSNPSAIRGTRHSAATSTNSS